MLVCCVRLLSDSSKKFEAKVRFLCSPQKIKFKRKDKPIGGGHCFENSSELTTRVGSTPTLSANVHVLKWPKRWVCKTHIREFESLRAL